VGSKISVSAVQLRRIGRDRIQVCVRTDDGWKVAIDYRPFPDISDGAVVSHIAEANGAKAWPDRKE
jgi:hypothetical protein